MSEIELVFPTEEMEAAATAFVAEILHNGEAYINGGAGITAAASYAEWLQTLRNNLHEDTVQDGRIPSTTYFACRKSDNAIVGIIDIRHRLNDFLYNWGGHIGYGVRPTERRKGYATQMLALALQDCKRLSIENVLVVCNHDNEISRATILKNGGIFCNELPAPDGKLIQRYWIDITKPSSIHHTK
ncbi:MAG: GNAT family N-acetyltransferase [Clostridiales bacterium]|nr:GNAT family N-acetyltransferase [Clostridiales bacterium]